MEKNEIWRNLKLLADMVPAPFYWADINCVVLGFNQPCIDLTHNIVVKNDDTSLIGKDAFDIYSPESAQIVHEHSQMVMQTGKALVFEEELIDLLTRETRHYICTRAPLFENGKVVGIIGYIVEITAQKEAEQLRIKQQEQFRKIAAQVAHDIGSPLASLKMIIPHCHTLPENTRNALNKAATRISDIAENFLSQFKPRDDEGVNHCRIPTLIMEEVLEILTEKKYQYNKSSIDFIINISQNGAFSFINIDTKAFKRMLSNLINNAVDAFEGKMGEIIVSLDEIDSQVLITITDNGKGMSKEVKNKILANIEVTSGKVGGHGIGFMQIRDALLNNEGTFGIESQLGIGTTIKLSFPKIEAPNWIAESIVLNLNDIVIILDDDDSIHSAWELRFENSAPDIQRYHFKQGYEAIDFINGISSENKNKIFLLTDYELLKQGLHGLDVIEKTGIIRSVLVTSHHNNQLVRDKALLTKTKILPKLLASNVAINYI